MANIYAINHKEDLTKALEEIESDSDLILVQNCQSLLKVGNREVKVSYPNAIYSWDRNHILLFPQNSEVQNIQEELSRRHLLFHEIVFMKPEEEKANTFEKQVVFVQTEEQLEKAFHNQETASIYPKVKGKLTLSYGLEEEKVVFDQFEINGALELEEKLLLFHHKAFLWKRVFPVLWNYNINSDIDWSTELPYFEEAKQYQKEQ